MGTQLSHATVQKILCTGTDRRCDILHRTEHHFCVADPDVPAIPDSIVLRIMASAPADAIIALLPHNIRMGLFQIECGSRAAS